MAIIQQPLIDGIIDYIEQALSKAQIVVAGQTVDYTIFKKTRVSNKIWVYILLNPEIGKVEEIQVLNAAGEAMAIKPVAIETNEDGHMVAFEFTVTVQEGV